MFTLPKRPDLLPEVLDELELYGVDAVRAFIASQRSYDDGIGSERDRLLPPWERQFKESLRLARLNVGDILAIPNSRGPLRVLHDPVDTPGKENEGHTLVIGYYVANADVKNQLSDAVLFPEH